MRRTTVGLLALGVLIGVGAAAAPASPSLGSDETLFGAAVPSYQTASDAQGWELGTVFSTTVSGTVNALRFLQLDSSKATRSGSLWDAAGRRLASVTFVGSGSPGWQTATLSTPVALAPYASYTVSYTVPAGGAYAVVPQSLAAPKTSADLRIPAAGGVYTSIAGTRPTNAYKSTNYLVDVVFSPSMVDAGGNTSGGGLGLPLIPWEGGPAYYAKFAGSSAFANPNVFPIGIWWGDFSTNTDVLWDKAHGINFYTQLNGSEDGRLLIANNMNVVQGADSSQLVKNLPYSDPHWAGWWTSDETDGKIVSATDAIAEMQREIDAQKAYCPTGGCKASYANYTHIVTSYYGADQEVASQRFINMVPGPTSVDRYYYTDPNCSYQGRSDWVVNAPDDAHCASSAAYGNLVSVLRQRDLADGQMKPVWGFVENGAPYENGKYITPDQMRGAVMSQVIHEARGIVWFNQSFSGSCVSGNVLRTSQQQPTGCYAAQAAAMKKVNLQLQRLAPVINTQSYAWDFGAPGIDTMLKASGGSLYVFSGVGLNADPGTRTFTLPKGVAATSVTVVDEGRTIPVVNGRFTDTFAHEYSYHIYRLTM